MTTRETEWLQIGLCSIGVVAFAYLGAVHDGLFYLLSGVLLAHVTLMVRGL